MKIISLFLLVGVFMIKVLVNGYSGNMGKILTRCIEETSDMSVIYGIDKENIEILEDLSITPDVIIDFSSPSASFIALDYAVCHLIPIVIATTGFTDEETKRIIEYSEAIPIFKCSNMSYTINLIGKLLSYITPMLSYMDIEILEKHHKNKKDSPSGTAFLLADYINSSIENKYSYTLDRHSEKRKRHSNEIGFSSVRGGSIVGEHSILFLGEDESIEITHTAYSRKVFAEGAIRAARFIVNKKNGMYNMEDLLY